MIKKDLIIVVGGMTLKI